MKPFTMRHGDLALVEISKLPPGLVETETSVLLGGSHGHDHTIDTGAVYLKKVDGFVFGYLVASGTTLSHVEHGDVRLKDGVYELRKQQEFTHDGMKPVID